MKAAAGHNNTEQLQEIYPTSRSPIQNQRAEFAAHGIDGDGETHIMLHFGTMKAARFKEQMTPLNLYRYAASRVTVEIEGTLYNGQAVREDLERDAEIYPFVTVMVRQLTPI